MNQDKTNGIKKFINPSEILSNLQWNFVNVIFVTCAIFICTC